MPHLRRLVLYLSVAAALALLNLGWVWISRHFDNERLERAAAARRRPPSASVSVPVGTALRISEFYANQGEIVEGEHAVVCYAVGNARSLRLDPPVEQLQPAPLTRCFAVTPTRTTRYQLTAEGAGGERASESFVIRVSPAPPRILFVEISAKEIQRGSPWTFCYGVRHATQVRLDPIGMKLQPSERSCRRIFPARTADFQLVAGDDLGRSDREKFHLTVY
jgi:hypothetical protein